MNSYKYRVVLDLAEDQEVFADILIPSNANANTLYNHIISEFKFSGMQMASFFLSNDNWDKGEEISFMDMSEDGSMRTMDKTVLNEIQLDKGDKMLLVYDFLRMWIFLIELVEISEEVITEAKTIIRFGDAPDEESKEMIGGEDLLGEVPKDEDFDYGLGDEYDLGDDDESLDEFDNIDDYDI